MPELSTTSLLNDANLQAYYKLEDTSDSKGANTLTNTNTATFVNAKFNKGASFGASNTNIVLQSANTLSIDGSSFTFCGWFQALAEIASSTWTFLSHANQTSKVREFIEYDFNGGTRRLIFNRDKTGVANDNFTSNLTMGTSLFYHIAMTYDATTLRGYVNGASVGSVAASGSGNTNSDPGIRIGAIQSSGSNAEFASILADDVAFFNRALTAAEIQTLFAGGHTLTPNSKFW